MKKHLFFILMIALFGLSVNAQQCLTGGCTVFTNQYPSGTLTPSTSWQTQVNMNGGNWTLFSVTSGNTYEWTYCEAYGGVSTGWDAQLTLFNNANLSTPICFSTDQCGTNSNAPYISWVATFTGTARILTTAYVSGTGGCQSNSGTPRNTLAYRKSSISCTNWYTSPANASFSSAGGTGSFSFYNTGGCLCYISSSVTWINNISINNGLTSYNVDPNSTCSSRIGYFYIKDANNVTQATYTVTENGGIAPAPTGIDNGAPNVCVSTTATVDLGGLGQDPSYLYPPGQWVWYTGSCGGTQVGTGTDYQVNISQAGTYTYYLRAESTCGNSSCVSTTVHVTANPQTPTPTIQGSTPCAGSNFTLLAAVTGTYYEWYGPSGGMVSNSQNPSITTGVAGQYCLSYEQNGCYSDEGCVNVTFNPLPTTNISINGNMLSCNPSNYQTYQWHYNGNVVGNNSPTLICLGTGSYYVSATDNNSCSNSSNTLNVGVCTVGISENESDNNFIIYPTPANDKITIESSYLNINKDALISIYNIQGQLLIQKPMLQAKINIGIATLAKGMYIIEVKTEKGIAVKKFIKE